MEAYCTAVLPVMRELGTSSSVICRVQSGDSAVGGLLVPLYATHTRRKGCTARTHRVEAALQPPHVREPAVEERLGRTQRAACPHRLRPRQATQHALIVTQRAPGRGATYRSPSAHDTMMGVFLLATACSTCNSQGDTDASSQPRSARAHSKPCCKEVQGALPVAVPVTRSRRFP